MIKAEFGIIPRINPHKDYSCYEPKKYACIAIDDDLYINDWWPKLLEMKTYFHTLSRPSTGLSRWGVTLIPPESLPAFLDIVATDPRFQKDPMLKALADKIEEAITANKYMIHYGV